VQLILGMKLLAVFSINCIYRGFTVRFLADKLCGIFQIPHLISVYWIILADYSFCATKRLKSQNYTAKQD